MEKICQQRFVPQDNFIKLYLVESTKMDFEDIPAAEEEEYNNAVYVVEESNASYSMPEPEYSMPEPESAEEDSLT